MNLSPLEERITALIGDEMEYGGGCVDGHDWDWNAKEFAKVRDALARKIAAALTLETAEALREAVAVARVCRDAIDAQTNVYLVGGKPNWKSAARTCFDEIADKPEVWEALAGAA